MRVPFNGTLEIEWVDVSHKMPLDDFKNKECNWGVFTPVFVLINDDEDFNEAPSIAMIEYLVDTKGIGYWCWLDGSLYPECHAMNIKFWADVPTYYKTSII